MRNSELPGRPKVPRGGAWLARVLLPVLAAGCGGGVDAPSLAAQPANAPGARPLAQPPAQPPVAPPAPLALPRQQGVAGAGAARPGAPARGDRRPAQLALESFEPNAPLPVQGTTAPPVLQPVKPRTPGVAQVQVEDI
jgi:hypothetical protein